MALTHELQEVISNPENLNKIIVAMPSDDRFSELNSQLFIALIRSFIKVVPQIIRETDFNFIYGDVNSFNQIAYKEDFLKKCESEIEGEVKLYTFDFS